MQPLISVPLTVDDLRRFGTRQLLRALRRSCASDEQIEKINVDRAWALRPSLEAYADKATYYEHTQVDARTLGYRETTVTIAQLKAELARRPHVPNKREARKVRRQKAEQGKDKGRRDR